ncbi:MAG: FAD-dependent monooxygenase [Bradyrhizobium sp.]
MRLYRRLRRLHGVSRASVKPSAIETFERVYPFGWLGILSETPPVSHELIYSNHRQRLCAVYHALDAPQPLLCPVQSRRIMSINGRTRDSGDELKRRLDQEAADNLVTGPSIEKEHRAVAKLCRRTDAVRAPVPGRRRRPHRAADGAKGLNLAASDVHYLSDTLREYYDEKSSAGIDGYSQKALGAGSGKRCDSRGG